MVSIIQSNYRGMGSGLMPDGLGFMFQDRGELFSLTDGHPNIYAPGKRPFQTIIPGFATKDGQPLLSFGVMGGDMQPQGQTQIIFNIVDYGLDLQEAGDSPRWHHDGGSEPTGEDLGPIGVLNLESGVPGGHPGGAGQDRLGDEARARRLRRLPGHPALARPLRRRHRDAQGRRGAGLLRRIPTTLVMAGLRPGHP